MTDDLKLFCAFIEHAFKNHNLLEEAITHPSRSKENKSKPNYQRLEFLGDKVLSLVIGEFLMQKYPTEMEGDLSKRQAALVSGETLAQIALQIGLEKVLLVSRGEKNLGGQTNKRNLENSLEALVGAIYLDSDYYETKKFVLRFWKEFLEQNIKPPKDPVSELQELAQIKTKKLPQYFTTQTGGTDHSPVFVSRVKLGYDDLEFEAEGKSKKEAQKKVSQVALEHIKSHQGKN